VREVNFEQIVTKKCRTAIAVAKSWQNQMRGATCNSTKSRDPYTKLIGRLTDLQSYSIPTIPRITLWLSSGVPLVLTS
jgi:hypothetical protein